MTTKPLISTGALVSEGVKLPPIICVGTPRWEGGDYLTSTVQLMSELALTERVLYVDYPFTYKDIWAAQRGTAKGIPVDVLRGQAPALQTRPLPHGGQVQLLRLPPFLPANFFTNTWLYDQVLKFNARRARKAIQLALSQLGWAADQPIVINAFNPALGNALAGQLNESVLLYYCYDEISAAPWIARHGARHERQMLQTADCTVVSSQGLVRTKKASAKQLELVKNGVDLSIFKTTDQGRPEDLPAGPIIGYIGSVDDRLDLELLCSVAKTFPETSLVFLGRIVSEEHATVLTEFPNVHLLGTRPKERLGDYVSAFTVGLIPFVKNDLTAGIYPLKINEYFALGVPVVSTRFADLSDFREYIRIGDQTSDFLAALEQVLNGKLPAEPEACQQFAAQNTWEGRANKLRHLLAELHQQKSLS
ncbi:MAG: glycosyltransferase [Bacteroidota bacterium]